MPIEPTEIPPATPGIPVEPPLESPPGSPQPDVPPPMREPGEAPTPDELPGKIPDEVPGAAGSQGPRRPYPATDAGIGGLPGSEPDFHSGEPELPQGRL